MKSLEKYVIKNEEVKECIQLKRGLTFKAKQPIQEQKISKKELKSINNKIKGLKIYK